MRTAALAIALLMSGAAIAQTYETDTTVDTDVSQPDRDQSVDSDVQTRPDMTTDTETTAEPGMTTQTDTTAQTTPPTETDTTSQMGTTSHEGMTHMGTTTQTEPMATTTTTPSQTGMTTAMAPASDPIVQPGNDNPEHDARGIAVISDPAMVPSGWNGVTGTAVGGPLVDPTTGETMATADASYPPCTADVTDNCLQAYERGRSS